MRSGQYKLTGAGTRGIIPDVTMGHFRSSQCDLSSLSSPTSEFPHLNSLVVTKSKLTDRPVNKSCENLSATGGGARGAVIRVEQRVKSLLQRGESRLRQQQSQGAAATAEDVWQYGHVVTLPRRPRLSLALSHSALNHITSDTASYLSASSGYSSSSSSNYGSFKSNTSSSCSTLPRHKPFQPPSPHPTRPVTFVDNPMYDVTPAVPRPRSPPPSPPEHIYDVTPDSDYAMTQDDPLYDTIPAHLNLTSHSSRLLTPDSGTHGGLDSLEESAPNSLECGEMREAEDQVARQCREYFERRLKNSENLKKRWSMCSSDSGADSGDSETFPQSLLGSSANSMPPSTSSSRVPNEIPNNDSQDAAAAATTTTTTTATAASGKTALDYKMEFLRKEIASLMSQDNALFRQLLTLHDSISALKTAPIHTLRPPSPSSLDSFTEEEEDEEQDDDDEEEEEDKEGNESHVQVGSERQQKTSKVEDLSEVDEGLETDHSTSHSTSPSSTLSSKCSWNSHCSSSKASPPSPACSPIPPARTQRPAFQRAVSTPADSQGDRVGPGNLAFMRSRKSYAPTARNRRRSSSAHLGMRPDLEMPGSPTDPAEGEGWGPDTPSVRPRSSSAILPPGEGSNRASINRPLPCIPYREALIM